MHFSDKDYQRLAEAIVSDFVSNSIPLQDSVIKTADEASMNANETRRLIEATNVHAHMSLFEKMADHKYVEFDAVDPNTVCDRLFANVQDTQSSFASSSEKIAHLVEQSLDLDNERYTDLVQVFDKTAAEIEKEEAVYDAYTKQRSYNAVSLFQKTASELGYQQKQAHLNWVEATEKLAHAFSFVDAPNFTKFACEAFALYGVNVEPTLRKVQELRPSLCIELEKKAQIKHVVEEKEHLLLKEAMRAQAVSEQFASGVKWLNKRSKKLKGV